ncbi:MAG: hypothetical protein CVV64_13315 [Candidatus Wallbacteria bacterium HGW-Wallbacteria-1]|jgi:HEAT repeat protein|uniref:Clathrin/coatomer adaptor adaptin-like N-terminal domain-containing protein n=1 Tax=Candidatus Wallbacteria bacterium HGW-Wallbacteria-1 TaxID=2013854 RepID=A0A2N1PMS2_9BACT|nr:MAG: hypothetical protein CVV64_13315 [Candidatus Wallbacteria bacterium HGW-Wallbacteria-1]
MKVAEILDKISSPDLVDRNDAFVAIVTSFNRDLLGPLAEKANQDSPELEKLFCRFLANMPSSLACPHAIRMASSPNRNTRLNIHGVILAMDPGPRLDTLIALLDSREKDSVIFAIKTFGDERKTLPVTRLLELLTDGDKEISNASFACIGQIDSPRAIPVLLKMLSDQSSDMVIRAIDTLGKMKSFRKWKKLLPCLENSDSQVRISALRVIARVGGDDAKNYLLAALSREEDAWRDTSTLNLILTRLAQSPDVKIAETLASMASHHPMPEVMKTASWILEELDRPLAVKGLTHALARAVDEQAKAFIISKMGHLELTECAFHLQRYLKPHYSERLRYSAMEGLGALGDIKNLPYIEKFIDSGDEMESYLATVAACMMISKIEDCPRLVALLRDRREATAVMRQVVLQCMLDTVNWSYDSDEMFTILRDNMQDVNMNVRYQSLLLLGRFRRVGTENELAEVWFTDSDPTVANTAADTLRETLRGDMSWFVEFYGKGLVTSSRWSSFLGLMSRMDVNSDSAEVINRTMMAFSASRPFESLSSEDVCCMTQLAAKVYKGAPLTANQFLDESSPGPPWRRLLGIAAVEAMADLSTEAEKKLWKRLQRDSDPYIVEASVRRAMLLKARWTYVPMLESVFALESNVGRGDSIVSAELFRRGVRTVLGL